MTPKPAVCMVGNVLGTGGVFISELPDGFTLTDAVADKLRAVITDSMAMSRISRLYDENAWKKLNPPDSLVRSIMFALEMQKRTEQWQKDGGQFVPHPATWLNQQRWLDEIGPAAPVAPDASKERARSVDVIKQREAMLRGQRA